MNPVERSTADDVDFEIDLSSWLDTARVGVFLRGATPATNDPAPDSAAPFPTFRSDRRGWSQTLLPLTTVTAGGP